MITAAKAGHVGRPRVDSRAQVAFENVFDHAFDSRETRVQLTRSYVRSRGSSPQRSSGRRDSRSPRRTPARTPRAHLRSRLGRLPRAEWHREARTRRRSHTAAKPHRFAGPCRYRSSARRACPHRKRTHAGRCLRRRVRDRRARHHARCRSGPRRSPRSCCRARRFDRPRSRRSRRTRDRRSARPHHTRRPFPPRSPCTHPSDGRPGSHRNNHPGRAPRPAYPHPVDRPRRTRRPRRPAFARTVPATYTARSTGGSDTPGRRGSSSVRRHRPTHHTPPHCPAADRGRKARRYRKRGGTNKRGRRSCARRRG